MSALAMLARVASCDSLKDFNGFNGFNNIPISSDLYEEIEFPESPRAWENEDDFGETQVTVPMIQLNARDRALTFQTRDQLHSYLYDEHQTNGEYVYFQYEPSNAPVGSTCQLVFRSFALLVEFVEKYVCTTTWVTVMK